MSTTVTQTVTRNLTAIRQWIGEATRRFEDAFNRGDAAGAALKDFFEK